MFIALVGLPLAGKDAIANWLVESLGFTRVRVQSQSEEPAEAIASSTHQTTFASSASLLSYATKSWRSDFVTTDLTTASDLDEFLKRPFFLLVGVEASASVRWSRATVRDGLDPDSLLAFRSFLDASDALLYGGGGSSASSSSSPSGSILPSTAPTLPVEESSLSRSLSTISIDPSLSPPTRVSALPSSSSRTPLHDILALSHLRIVNNHSTLDQLSAHLALLNLADPERVRPSWDTYFMTLASLASLRSNCMKRRVGAILVRDRRIVSTGYNGTPRGMRNCNEGGCGRCNRGEERGGGLNLCVCLHAEENALLEAGRERVGSTATLYCNTCPCLPCAVKIVQSGVKEVVYNLAYAMDEESARVLREGGVQLRRLSPVGGQ